ncbi:hypothetical protein EYR40_010657 [Pleurotus pulmonarius]|nr:hypothetical protein EYR36_002431 [Pleurotus pulmonarius]KAF4586643.1 hypothetical protein EYR40_010657 [Pleurotus pulmonarius]
MSSFASGSAKDVSVGRVIGYTRQRLEIFPGLQALAFESNFHLVPLFLHHGVKQLSFVIDTLPATQELSVNLPYIAPSVPTLRHLTVTGHQGLGPSLDVVVEMLKCLGHLQSPRLPLQWFAPAVINELVYHDELSYLGITTPAGECFEMQGPENDIFSITMPKQGGIPSLTELNLAVEISTVAKCLPHLDALRTLTLLPPQAASSNTLSTFIAALSDRTPSLASLTIDFQNPWPSPASPGNCLTESPSFGTPSQDVSQIIPFTEFPSSKEKIGILGAVHGNTTSYGAACRARVKSPDSELLERAGFRTLSATGKLTSGRHLPQRHTSRDMQADGLIRYDTITGNVRDDGAVPG